MDSEGGAGGGVAGGWYDGDKRAGGLGVVRLYPGMREVGEGEEGDEDG